MYITDYSMLSLFLWGCANCGNMPLLIFMILVVRLASLNKRYKYKNKMFSILLKTIMEEDLILKLNWRLSFYHHVLVVQRCLKIFLLHDMIIDTSAAYNVQCEVWKWAVTCPATILAHHTNMNCYSKNVNSGVLHSLIYLVNREGSAAWIGKLCSLNCDKKYDNVFSSLSFNVLGQGAQILFFTCLMRYNHTN